MEEKVIALIDKSDWKDCLYFLKKIIDKTDLEPTIKWGIPTYCINNKNVIGLIGFKKHCGIWFYNGAFLEDKKQVLINAQEGKTKAMRSWKFSNLDEIKKAKKEIAAYIIEAIKNQKEGKVLKPSTKKPLSELPIELKNAFKKNKSAKQNFEKYSISKKNEFIEYIATAKREATKLSRIEKIIPMFETGACLHDKYK